MSIKKFCKTVKIMTENAKKESVSEYLKKSRITLISDSEMTIEGELFINNYNNLEVDISSDEVDYNISGSHLNLCYIKSNTLRITGIITKICIVKR